MEIIISGIVVNIMTFVAKKLNLSGTYVSIGLCLILGSVYFIYNNIDPQSMEKVLFYLLGMYAQSQVVYGLLKKLGILEKIQ